LRPSPDKDVTRDDREGKIHNTASPSIAPNIEKPPVKQISQHPSQQQPSRRKEKAMSLRQRRERSEDLEVEMLPRKSGATQGSVLIGGGDVILLMELALDKLELLNYRISYLQKRDIVTPLTPTEFALPPTDARRQHAVSASFMSLVEWIIQDHLGVQWNADDMQTSLHNSRSLLTILTNQCNLSAETAAALVPASLSKGTGHTCCVVLNFLLDLALQRKGMALLPAPTYNDAADNAYDEEIGGSDDVEEEMRNAKNGRIGGDSNDGEQENEEEEEEVYYGGGVARGPDAALTAPWDLKKLFTMADEETRKAWRIECERVGPILHRTNVEVKKSLSGGGGTSMATASAWRMHLSTLRHHLGSIERAKQKTNSRNNSDVVHPIFSSPESMPWATDLATLKRGQPLLTSLFGRMEDEYRTILNQETLIHDKVQTRRSNVGKASERLTEMSERSTTLRDEVGRIGAGVSDTSPLQVSG